MGMLNIASKTILIATMTTLAAAPFLANAGAHDSGTTITIRLTGGGYTWTSAGEATDCGTAVDPFPAVDPPGTYYVWCSNPSHPSDLSGYPYTCAAVDVTATIDRVIPGPRAADGVYAGSWCVGGGTGAECTVSGLATCTDGDGSDYGMWTAEVGCKTTKNGPIAFATITCGSTTGHVPETSADA
jgi:hypothetical protein